MECLVSSFDFWTDASTDGGNELQAFVDRTGSLCSVPGRVVDFDSGGAADTRDDWSGCSGEGTNEDYGGVSGFPERSSAEVVKWQRPVCEPSSLVGETGVSMAMLYPPQEPHSYPIQEVHRWSRRMLTPEEFRILKTEAFRLDADSLPRSELTGLYFNKHRPCWSVDYYSRQRKRKTIDFFVPDVTKATLGLVLKCASACRLVLPRRFEEVPVTVPEPDEATGGLPYRGGAAYLEPAVLNWILRNRLRGDQPAAASNDSKRMLAKPAKEPRCNGKAGGSFLHRTSVVTPPSSPARGSESPPAISPALTCESLSEPSSYLGSPSLVTPVSSSPVQSAGSLSFGGEDVPRLSLPQRALQEHDQGRYVFRTRTQPTVLLQYQESNPLQEEPLPSIVERQWSSGFGLHPFGRPTHHEEAQHPEPQWHREEHIVAGGREPVARAGTYFQQLPLQVSLPSAIAEAQSGGDLNGQSSEKWEVVAQGSTSVMPWAVQTKPSAEPVALYEASHAIGGAPMVSSNTHMAGEQFAMLSCRGKRPFERDVDPSLDRPVRYYPLPRVDCVDSQQQEVQQSICEAVAQQGFDKWQMERHGGVMEKFVALATSSADSGLSCWGLPIDMLQEWYEAAEAADVASDDSSHNGDSEVRTVAAEDMPFCVTIDQIAAAAALGKPDVAI